METWYLIIILISSGKAADHIEFTNQAACVSVRNEIIASLHEGYIGFIDCKKDR